MFAFYYVGLRRLGAGLILLILRVLDGEHVFRVLLRIRFGVAVIVIGC